MLYTNGFIIQQRTDNPYKGVDGSGFSENTGQSKTDWKEIHLQFICKRDFEFEISLKFNR